MAGIPPPPPTVAAAFFNPVTHEDVVAFMQAKDANIECPVCKWKQWTVQADSDLAIEPHQPNRLFASPVGVIAIICNNCGYLRLHSKLTIQAWKSLNGRA